MQRGEFLRLVHETVATLPPELLRRVQNVEIVVEDRPTLEDLRAAGVARGHTLLGLYHGVPLTHRTTNYNLVPPNIISIYREPILRMCDTEDEIREQVRKTVLHEIGHYFGIDDARLHELGMG